MNIDTTPPSLPPSPSPDGMSGIDYRDVFGKAFQERTGATPYSYRRHLGPGYLHYASTVSAFSQWPRTLGRSENAPDNRWADVFDRAIRSEFSPAQTPCRSSAGHCHSLPQHRRTRTRMASLPSGGHLGLFPAGGDYKSGEIVIDGLPSERVAPTLHQIGRSMAAEHLKVVIRCKESPPPSTPPNSKN